MVQRSLWFMLKFHKCMQMKKHAWMLSVAMVWRPSQHTGRLQLSFPQYVSNIYHKCLCLYVNVHPSWAMLRLVVKWRVVLASCNLSAVLTVAYSSCWNPPKCRRLPPKAEPFQVRPVTSWNGRVEISCPAAATPRMTLVPQPLWQASSAALCQHQNMVQIWMMW